ncbi:hypothetical protein L226DRAFT_544207 [Lentinus tigrinus ALCF2SS1-7]|uniref:uncharacterized protein n=1 Tax=Lentinus tigrinus ALCF2SS1-7 TaxID=1328758 RepID=UPI001165E7B4|nr:hypothetical protein L226DRAFT_544207 [Lentinus tigrinus ALCF2SS1-7]
MSSKTDSSKIIHHLLSIYPTLFLPGMVQVLPTILAGIVSTSMLDRVDATVALSGYALAFLSTGPRVEALNGDIVKAVRQLLIRPLPGARDRTESKTSKTSGLLTHLINRATKEDTPETKNVGSRWAVTTVCSLICLTGHRVFSGQKACALALETARLVLIRKPNGYKELLACLWRCLIWAFSRVPHDGTRADNVRSGPFDTVKQELRFGAGACLISTLLYCRPGHPQGSADASGVEAERAISVLKDMVASSEDCVHRDGVWVLARMVSRIGSGDAPRICTWSPDDLIVRDLFSRQMSTMDPASIASTIRQAISNRPEVRPLEEVEIQLAWDDLRDIWLLCVRRELQKNQYRSLSNELVGIWQALLLVRTHLTQEQGHLTATEDFTNNVVSIIADFLRWSLQGSEKSSPTATAAQSRGLSLCAQLWTVVSTVFSEAWLSKAANTLLTRILQHTFEISADDVKAAWSRMCGALISSSSPGLVARLVAEDEEHRTAELRRELWYLTAMSWASIEPQPSLEDAVEFLCVPAGVWSPSGQELAAWDDVLEYTISQASTPAGPTGAVFDSLIRRVLGGQEASSLIRVPWLIIRLLSRWREAGDFTSTLLGTVAACFTQVYPENQEQLDSTENLGPVLQIVAQIWDIIRNCPPASIMSILAPLADGLAVWIGDEHEYVPVQEYNKIIVPLYCDALEALRHIPINSDTLHALARFLRSTFNRIPEPGHGPHAFCNFWQQIQPSLGHLDGGYPEDLKVALCVCHQVFDMSLPSDLSIDTESQTESQEARSMPLVRSSNYRMDRSAEIHTNSCPPVSSQLLQKASRALGLERGLLHSHYSHKSDLRRSRLLPAPVSPTPALRSSDASRSSNHILSSPTDAIRARRFVKGPSSRTAHERPSKTPDRPVKRRKLSPLSKPKGTPGSSSVVQSSPLAIPSKRGRDSHDPSPVTPKRSRRLSADVEGQSPSGSKRRASTACSSTPQPSPSKRTLKDEQLLSPEVPSPETAARLRARAPPADDEDDDYDTWEVPIVDDDVVPDSQPDYEHDHEDSLVPSFMKGLMDSTQPADDAGDSNDDFQDVDDLSWKALGKRPERKPALRMQTAPASFIHDPDSIDIAAEASVPMRRAHTESVSRLEELRNMCDVLEEDGSQLDVEEMLAMSKFASRIGTIMSEKLSKKLSGGGSPTETAGGHSGSRLR